MKEETKQRIKKSVKPAIFAIVWLIACIFIIPVIEDLKDNVFPGLYFLMIALAYGVPAFAAFRAIEPWVDYESEPRQPRKRREK